VKAPPFTDEVSEIYIFQYGRMAGTGVAPPVRTSRGA